jgi:hypothetical protein
VVRPLLGLRRRLELARVGGELGLEPGDLAAQLGAGAALVGVAGDVGKRGGGDGVERHRDLAGLEPGRLGPGERLADELAELGGDRGVVGHVGAGALARGDEALVLEAPVDGADRVHVHAAALGELADARQALARPSLARADEGPQLPVELGADRQLAGWIDGEPLGDQEPRRVRHGQGHRGGGAVLGQTPLRH